VVSPVPAAPVSGTAGTGTDRPPALHPALLFVLSGTMLLDAVEVSVVLVALPRIGDDLGLSALGAQWLMSGFAIGFAALLILGPRLTARVGRRAAYLAAMTAFVLACAAGGALTNPVLLVALRVVKGGCAALTAPAGLAFILETFPDGPGRRRAISVYSTFGAMGFTVGLLLSGALAGATWRWVFVLPAPVAAVLLLFGMMTLPRESSRPVRLPRLAVLRDVDLRRSAGGAATLNGTYQGLLVLLVFRVHDGLGWSPWRTALALLPACVPLALAAPWAGRLIARYGTARLIALGALLPAVGVTLALAHPEPTPYVTGMLPVLLLVEAGFCCAFGALNAQATGRAAPADRAAAIAVYQCCVQLGAAALLPLVALLYVSSAGVRAPLAVLAAVAVLGLVISLVPARPTDPSRLWIPTRKGVQK
jgi:MFS family permease